MASATSEKKEKPMATDVTAPAPNEGDNRSERRPGERRGFFSIHKRGQGYWTRMGTAAGVLIVALLMANFMYTQMRVFLKASTAVSLGVSLAVFAALSVLSWRLMNRPTSVDFLIATDSEMKKVNWTTRKELIGSTKVVILFVVLIAIILFLLDVMFGFLFHLFGVLEFGPFQ